jgi:hypothetical protein
MNYSKASMQEVAPQSINEGDMRRLIIYDQNNKPDAGSARLQIKEKPAGVAGFFYTDSQNRMQKRSFLMRFLIAAVLWLISLAAIIMTSGFKPVKVGSGTIHRVQGDTIVINAQKVNTKFLTPSVNRYLVYFKMGKDSARSRAQFWTRRIEYIDYNGSQAIMISQEWEDRDTVVHAVQSVCDKKTFAPLYHKSWWRVSSSGEFDFVNKTASLNGVPLSDADTARNRKGPWNAFKIACDQYVLNWHLDLEVFSLLPYKKGMTFLIPFYDPGFPAPRNEPYTVTGAAELDGYNGQTIDCWLLTHESRGLKEIFWISKKSREVLKLEQEIGKNRWRYKIKLGFSI